MGDRSQPYVQLNVYKEFVNYGEHNVIFKKWFFTFTHIKYQKQKGGLLLENEEDEENKKKTQIKSLSELKFIKFHFNLY